MEPLLSYVKRFDRPETEARSNTKGGLTATVVLGLYVALASWVPWTRAWLRLDPTWTMTSIAAWTALLLAANHLAGIPSTRGYGLSLLLVGSASLQWFFMCVVVDSEPWPVRFAAGTALLFTLGSHGDGLRVTLDAPYHALVSLGFLVATLSRCATLEVTVFLLFVHAAGLFSMFSLGHVRVTSDRALERLEREREAVAANLLAQSHSTAARLERELTEVLGAHHDARNLLTNAVLASRGLQRRLLTGDGAPPDVALIQASLGKIDSALALVTSLFHQSTSRGMAGAPFDASPVIRAQLADFHSRRPAVTLHVAALPGASLDLPGGPTTFRRILDNLLLNAAEGDGTRGAHNLWLEATPEDGRLHLRLSDDGPGFPAEVLTSSRQRFTLKKDGSGLGLLTVDSLVRACSGVLQLSNRTRGGAQVDVFLPLHAPPDQGAQEATA